ncbi:hypothetical protein VE02_06775 [Pseudogymnoascus sp. 03VT05]|nr:hypothetical protein VE02_06775 [Pseudogymnoascus sp. 03VT05]
MQKSLKIKAVTLKFYGKALTYWEDKPRNKSQLHEEEKLRYQVLTFYNALYSIADAAYGAQCNYIPLNCVKTSSTELARPESVTTTDRSDTILSVHDLKRLSLKAVQPRIFQKGGSPATTTPQKGYNMFQPGIYEYSFEIVLDQSCPETTNLPLGGVRWMLEAIVEREGIFKPDLHGTMEVTVVRTPDENSVELVQPVAMSKKWEDQLYYDVVILGKSFPIGSKIPIAFKLTPLAKVRCHGIKVYLSENVDYFCGGKRVMRKDSQRKLLLLEWNAGKPLAPEYRASDIRTLAGGEPPGEARERARIRAQNWRQRFAKHLGTTLEPQPAPTDNLLGDLELGLDHLATQTEFETDVQLPTCEDMQKNRAKMLHPVTTYKNIQVHHWIEIVMSLSKVDSDDPTGAKRRQSEVSVASPVHILSCLATRAQTSLPEYCRLNTEAGCQALECGCPNAAAISNFAPPSPTRDLLSSAVTSASTVAANADGIDLPNLAAVPAQAHLSTSEGPIQRPIHILRAPSYNPPAFEADVPPPLLKSPPPLYDQVVGTPSRDGLADYFARLEDVCLDHHSEEELDQDPDDQQNRARQCTKS